MAPRDFKAIEGRQRAVWVRPGGQVLDEGELLPVDVVIVESGVMTLEDWFQLDGLGRFDVTAPIIDLPGGVQVNKVVAAAWPSSFGSTDEADSFGWAVDTVDTRIDPGSNTVLLVIHAAVLGTESNVLRYGYHITLWLAGRPLAVQDILRRLETA